VREELWWVLGFEIEVLRKRCPNAERRAVTKTASKLENKERVTD
jgi:hypothetical protein